MSNIQRLAKEGNKNHRIFVDALITLKASQGFYCRLYNHINEMDEDTYLDLFDLLSNQDFKDTFVERNCEMIDKSDYCIFYYNKDYIPKERRNSGTKIAYEYAMRKHKEIINIYKKPEN